MHFLYPLFACTIFVSSFLLFLVQPLLGKHIIPWYGGSSAVWVTAMLFFMVALAVGYGYALWLTRLSVWYQTRVQMALLIISLVVVWQHSQHWSSALTPPIEVMLSGDPSFSVFLLLTLVVGLPFVVLSATSTLLQYWYGRLTKQEPFALYGISNVGSFLGLLGYPFVFEPLVANSVLGQWWALGFFVYVLFSGMILYVVSRQVVAAPVMTARQRWSKWSFFVATMLAAVPVATMLAGTSLLTASVAPVPFLWVGPLALYLLSFVITFRTGRRPPMFFNEVFLVVSGIATVFLLLYTTTLPIIVTIVGVQVVMFAVFHWCHERLYLLRPDTELVPLFYLALSFGGIVGSVLLKLSVYLIPVPIEFLLIMLVVVLVVLGRWWQAEAGMVFRLSKRLTQGVVLVFGLSIVVSTVWYVQYTALDRYAATRNFFGFKSIHEETRAGGVVYRSLTHGLTNHGFQVIAHGEPLVLPVSYYGRSSGVGRVFTYLEDRETPKRVAIAGLGSGGLLAYCAPGDSFTYFEIDPAVVAMAQKYFTYIASCSGVTIEVADARLALEAKRAEGTRYDVVVIDAYADDMVPMHLMTTEALALYRDILHPNGVIAVHVSSRYLNLRPVLQTSAAELGLAVRYLYDDTPASAYAVASEWMILAQTEEVFSHEALRDFPAMVVEEPIVWTDAYSSLLPIIRW